MKTLSNINLFILTLFLYATVEQIQGLAVIERELKDDNEVEILRNDKDRPKEEDIIPDELHPRLYPVRSNSAEKYFDWASKADRPMEYLRGRRFWLFTKKDENALGQEVKSNAGSSSNSLSQGIWRSGIVGRR